jgi:hypothetical protein
MTRPSRATSGEANAVTPAIPSCHSPGNARVTWSVRRRSLAFRRAVEGMGEILAIKTGASRLPRGAPGP